MLDQLQALIDQNQEDLDAAHDEADEHVAAVEQQRREFDEGMARVAEQLDALAEAS